MSAHATFTGIGAILSATMTYNAHGIVPSSISISFPPQSIGTPLGTFRFVDPERGSAIEFKNCLLDSMSSEQSASGGWIVNAILIDERWTWQNRVIHGAYNTRQADGSLDPKRKRTTHQLATLLFRAIGIQDFVLGDLPNVGNPTVKWEYANAATELNKLVQDRGCRIVRQLDGRVKICRLGYGGSLPNYPDLAPEISLNPANKPNIIRVVFGPVEWQTRFKLQAVAEESDGRLVPIDKASYKPQGGWGGENPSYFAGVPQEYPPPKDKTSKRQLALRSVFRMYQLDPSQKLSITGVKEPKIEQVLPISDTLLETAMIAGTETRKPAIVKGRHVVDAKISIAENSPVDEDVNVKFSIDKKRGLVVFNDPVFKTDGSDSPKFEAAELYLTVGHNCINTETGLPYRTGYDANVPGSLPGGGIKVIHANYLNLQYRSEKESNEKEIERERQAVIRDELQGYASAPATGLTTPGIRPCLFDGAVQQAQWQCSGMGPAITRISRNAETDPYLPDYKTRQEAAVGNKSKVAALENKVEEIKYKDLLLP